MTITLDLPQELERELSGEAARLGFSLSEYALRILSRRPAVGTTPKTGAELVAYWQDAGLVGTRTDITDSQQHARAIRARTQYLRMLIEEGIGIDELRSVFEQMDKIDQAFESGETDALMKEADEYAEKKVKEWCAKHGLEYNPTDEESAQEFINAAVKRVRAEEKEGLRNVI